MHGYYGLGCLMLLFVFSVLIAWLIWREIKPVEKLIFVLIPSFGFLVCLVNVWEMRLERMHNTLVYGMVSQLESFVIGMLGGCALCYTLIHWWNKKQNREQDHVDEQNHV